jgi:uncharacterized protein YdeI (YjbR/CyaY-like superfamily)
MAISHTNRVLTCEAVFFIGLAYQECKDIVFRFIIEHSSFKGFWPILGNNNRSIFIIWGFLKDDILTCVETWDLLESYNILKDFGLF